MTCMCGGISGDGRVLVRVLAPGETRRSPRPWVGLPLRGDTVVRFRTSRSAPRAHLWSDPRSVPLPPRGPVGDSRWRGYGPRRFGAAVELAVDGRRLLPERRAFSFAAMWTAASFPLTGYPPEDRDVYAPSVPAIAKAWGFNHVRLHSWVPSRAFFDAADEAGMLVQCELPNWSNANDPRNVDGSATTCARSSTALWRIISAIHRWSCTAWATSCCSAHRAG